MTKEQEELVFTLLEMNLNEVGSVAELKDMLCGFGETVAEEIPDWKEKVRELAKKSPNRKIMERILEEMPGAAAGAPEQDAPAADV